MSRDEKIKYLMDHSNLGYNMAKKIKNDASQLAKYSDDQINNFVKTVRDSRSQGFTTVLLY
ncbi:hypothetical protein OXT66_03055 [Lentilactobacillus senioris]|uniref:hypothetical protein n=1 Tax=Lentilactobacillus senioris TaxID=931534 RepID=UPI0022806EBD|nr:hypothetical protein [Lentilactobacillus senioris]MCY9806527.1 hypothetical protein [Lentilactobacillus senioris]